MFGIERLFERQNIKNKAQEESKLDADLVTLALISSVLAAFGIQLGNEFVLIGAMLVSPLIDPIISVISFLHLGEWRKSLGALARLIFVLFLSLLVALIAFLVFELVNFTPRVSYTPFVGVEYFFVALLLGLVGTLLWFWPNSSNTAAGLSMAISLVPPLANISRGFALLDQSLITESVFSTCINIVGLMVGAALVFWLKINRD
jgi:uncharacterized hydrophobic protein (TIGR00271 family)